MHPFVITYLALALQHAGRIMTGAIAIAFYFAVLAISMVLAVVFRKIGERLPLVNKLTIGVYPKK